MGLKLSGLVTRSMISLERLRGKAIAVDAPQMLYQFLSSIRQRDGTLLTDAEGNITSHLMGFSTRIPNIMSAGVKLCFVFDGKPPELKRGIQQTRAERKIVAERKLEEARLRKDTGLMLRYSKQTARLTKDMLEESKELLMAFGLPVVQAPSEAEAQASFMCRKGAVWTVASNDYDCLLYGATRILLNLSADRDIELIEYDTVLEGLGIDHQQLLALAILIGTDYNPKGVHGIGPKRALEIVRKERTAEKILGGRVENWRGIVETIEHMPVTEDYRLRWSNPDEEMIKKILLGHDFSMERVNKIVEKAKPKQHSISDFC